jgi:TetR/AcrR family transcriptional regulator, cholesterol catabolism regulator
MSHTGVVMNATNEEQKPWRQRRRTKEAQIRDAAVAEFCLHGYAGASLQSVADAVNMNKASLYHYVESKENLLASILDYAHDQIIAIMDDLARREADPMGRLRAFLETHLTWYLENLELAKVTYHEWTNLSGDLLEAQRNRRRRYDTYLRDLIRAGQTRGAINRDWDVTLAANYITGAINAVPSWYHSRGRKNAAAIAGVYADMAIAMLTGQAPD